MSKVREKPYTHSINSIQDFFFLYFETSIIPIHVRNKAHVIVFVAEKPPMRRNVVWNTKNTNATFIMWKNKVEYERKDEDKLSTYTFL